MRKRFHIVYLDGVTRREFKVLASNKNRAIARFREVVSTTAPIVDVVNYTRVIFAKLATLVCLSAVLVSVLVVCLSNKGHGWKNYDIVCYDEYTVSYGDTLWELTELSNGHNNMDPRVIIDDICEKSECSSTIYAGQTIYIPCYNLD